MIVDVKRIVRPVRGGSQGYLVEGSDAGYYIAKFAGNPAGTRTLINEWVAFLLFQWLEVSSPALRILRLSEKIRDEAGLCFSIGHRRIPVQAGLHLGSQCPVNPITTAIFDFLPRGLLGAVVNVHDFAKAFVLDTLLGQADTRQCIFVRNRGCGASGKVFRAYMIDHGGIFGGSRWVIQDSPAFRRVFDMTVYSIIDMDSVCGHAVEVTRKIPLDEVYDATADLPSTWFAEADYDRLAELFTEVEKRFARLDSLVSWYLRALLPQNDRAVAAENKKAKYDGSLPRRILP